MFFSQAHLFSALVGFGVLTLIISWGRVTLPVGEAPVQKISLQAGIEFFTSFIVGVCDSVMGPKGRPMVPVFGAIFLIIWLQNLFTLFPGFTAATDNFKFHFSFWVLFFFSLQLLWN